MAQAVPSVSQSAQGRTGPRFSPARREAVTGWLFAAPWLIGFLLFTAGPMLFSLIISFTKFGITTPPKWIGTQNYSDLLQDDRFYQSLGNTFWMVLVKVPVIILLSLGVAILLNIDLPGAKAFRAIFYLPNVLSGVAAVFLWQWILLPDGLLNKALKVFGVEGPAWFDDPNWTKPGLVVMGTWWIGSNVLIFLAGLKGVPTSLYEAARIDGANALQQTRSITIPLLSPTIFFQVVTAIIGTFQIFTTAFIIASSNGHSVDTGGPDGSLYFYVFYLYNRAFGKTGNGIFQMGYASAMAWILFVVILVVTLIQLGLAKRWVYYEN